MEHVKEDVRDLKAEVRGVRDDVNGKLEGLTVEIKELGDVIGNARTWFKVVCGVSVVLGAAALYVFNTARAEVIELLLKLVSS